MGISDFFKGLIKEIILQEDLRLENINFESG